MQVEFKNAVCKVTYNKGVIAFSLYVKYASSCIGVV